MRYCSYQERTEQEVRKKLQALGMAQKEDQLIQVLKEENFLNEERYVAAFISGKFQSKHWGKRRISLALTQKGVDPALIHKGLDAIEAADYLQCIRKVAEKKKKLLVAKDPMQVEQRLSSYLLQKGYEPDLVQQTVQGLLKESYR